MVPLYEILMRKSLLLAHLRHVRRGTKQKPYFKLLRDACHQDMYN